MTTAMSALRRALPCGVVRRAPNHPSTTAAVPMMTTSGAYPTWVCTRNVPTTTRTGSQLWSPSTTHHALITKAK